MSLEDILSRIRTDADTEAERIRGEALRECREAEETQGRVVEEQFTRELERLRLRVLDHRKRMEFHIRREAGRRLLNARRTLLDDAIAGAVRKLTEAGDREYLELIGALIRSCDLEGEVEVIIHAGDEHRITPEFLKKLSTKKRKLVLSAERHGQTGGVILRSGRVSQNATFSMIADLFHEEMVMRLAPQVPVENGD